MFKLLSSFNEYFWLYATFNKKCPLNELISLFITLINFDQIKSSIENS